MTAARAALETDMDLCLGPIPDHLRAHDWYARHQAWLRPRGLPHHDPGDAEAECADLTGADLRGARLSGAFISGAYLRRAVGLPDAPVIPDIHRAVLAAIEAPGHALDMDEWHTCETTHCRAGWVVTLAGDAGRRLEERLGTSAAAALIYQASDPTLERVPDWCATDEDAMADIRRMAGPEPR